MQDTMKKFYLADSVPKGCGWTWIRMDKFVKRTKTSEKDLLGDEAEYLGLIDILQYLDRGSRAVIILSSEVVWRLFNGRRLGPNQADKPERLRKLRDEARKVIRKRNLEVEVRYVDWRSHPLRRMVRSWKRTDEDDWPTD